MDNKSIKNILARFKIYYGTVNNSFKCKFNEPGFFEYFNEKQTDTWLDLFNFFPETVGSENEIIEVISGKRETYSLNSLNRYITEDTFFNIYFLNTNEEKKESCSIVIRDFTNELLSRQSLQQRKNEIQILQQQLIEKNDSLDNLNKELSLLNSSLEKKVNKRTHQLEESTNLSQRLFAQTVQSLIYALEKRDAYTAGHQHRVSILACAIAHELGYDDFTIEGIQVAGDLHDLGKIYVPNEFLTKPGKLTEEEFAVIKTHPRVGFEILKDIEFPWPVATYVLQHHERIDGSGYPYGLLGSEIKQESKILMVADVVEAMATHRPYRISPGLDNALGEIVKNKGSKYDPLVTEACKKIIEKDGFTWE